MHIHRWISILCGYQLRTLSRPERASYKRYGDDAKTGLIPTMRSPILGGSRGYPNYPG